MQKQNKITFKTLSQICPELVEIQADAQRVLEPSRDVATYWGDYENIKSRIKGCVGLYAKGGLPDFVYTAEAYDCVHATILGDAK